MLRLFFKKIAFGLTIAILVGLVGLFIAIQIGKKYGVELWPILSR